MTQPIWQEGLIFYIIPSWHNAYSYMAVVIIISNTTNNIISNTTNYNLQQNVLNP